MGGNSRTDTGAYTPHYPRPVIDTVKKLFLRGDRYEDIADAVKRIHNIKRFSKNNVAGMVSRLRNRKEIEPAMRKGGHRPKRPISKYDESPAPITLPYIPRSRFT